MSDDSDAFPPEEAMRRFNAAMHILVRAPKLSNEELKRRVKEKRRGPELHEIPTEVLEARARALRCPIWHDEDTGAWVVMRDGKNVAFAWTEEDARTAAEAIRAKVKL